MSIINYVALFHLKEICYLFKIISIIYSFLSLNMNKPDKKLKVAIALSGGGARGIAHIGVLAALEKYGIKPDIISGTSMGALVGVFYAAGFQPDEILELIKVEKLYRAVKWAFPSTGLLDLEKVEKAMSNKIEIDDFKSLKKKFICAVTNLNSGMTEYVSEGKLFDYVLASASVPVLFEPKVINGHTYVDGGLLNNLPVQPLVEIADIIIGVNVNHNGYLDKIDGLKNIAERSFSLAINQNVPDSLNLCDFSIEPDDVRKFSTYDFNKAEEIYKIGFEATENYILEFSSFIDLNKVSEEIKKRRDNKLGQSF